MATILEADRVLDCKGMLCPMPIVKISKEVKAAQIGQVIKMIATDKGAPADMQAWSRQTGNELLDSHEENGTFIFFIRRTK
ncbi:MAG: sulfurtransferase TusA family protein [Chloroflexi bacterium]|nr:sulfurtransferase TusA family protein [Chloroflexota bacterium]